MLKRNKNNPVMIAWILNNNSDGYIKFAIGHKYYTYKFHSDARGIMLKIRDKYKYAPFGALGMAKKLADDCIKEYSVINKHRECD